MNHLLGFGTIDDIAIANADPNKIPNDKNVPTNVPTCSLLSSRALEGALIAH